MNKTIDKPLQTTLTTAGDNQHQASRNPEKQTCQKQKSCGAETW